jgi:hypothetical protein
MVLLLAAALGLLGLVAGIYVSTLIHDHRVADLSAPQYVAMHQMRDKTFRRVMPAIGLTPLALVLLSVLFAISSGLPLALGCTGAALLVLDIVFTVTRQVPLNARMQGWTEATIPADWSRTRDQWASQHLIRTAICLVATCVFSRPHFSPWSDSRRSAAAFLASDDAAVPLDAGR